MAYRSPFKKSSRQTTAYKKPGSWKAGFHTGVDRVCDIDRTIVAIADGYVQRVNDCGTSYGYHLTYRTFDGMVVLCAHLARSPLVKPGQRIRPGQALGVMGNTGNSSGAHLHIELQFAESWGYAKNLRNPNDYINWNNCGNTAEGEFEMKEWQNGASAERVYQTVANCKAKRSSIGTLGAKEKATCLGIVDGCYLVVYNAAGTKKCGFVAYNGGVSA